MKAQESQLMAGFQSGKKTRKKYIKKKVKDASNGAKGRRMTNSMEEATAEFFRPGSGRINKLTGFDVIQDSLNNQASDQRLEMNSTNRRVALQKARASATEGNRAQVKTDARILNDAAKMFTATGTCRIDQNGGWKIRGMRSSLEAYQMIGSAFMRYRESFSSPSGGFLADAMGLGVSSAAQT